MRKILAIIPARGGSKGVPRKNIRLLAGKPLIAWTIETALACSKIGRTIVSTEDREISRIAKECGADVPFLRPKNLAEDTTAAIPVVHNVVASLKEQEAYVPELVMYLQPTSPFRTSEDLNVAISLFDRKTPDAVVSVCETNPHPLWIKTIGADGYIHKYLKRKQAIYRRQDLPPVYRVNGAIYLNKRISLERDMTFIPKRTLPYLMPAERSLDIDTPWDFHLADLVMKDLQKE